MIISSKDKTKQNMYMQSDKEVAQYFSKSSRDDAINYSLD